MLFIYSTLIVSIIHHIDGVYLFNELRKYCDDSKKIQIEKKLPENVPSNIVTINNPSHKGNLSKNKSIKDELKMKPRKKQKLQILMV